MEEAPLFKQPSKISSISSRCIARYLMNNMGSLIENITFHWKSDSTAEHLNVLTKWLHTVKGWWENDIIVDPSSPMHEAMKDAIVQAAAEKWKNKEIAWAAMLTSYLFDSLTIDCICWSTDEPSQEVDEELYQEVLTRVSPLALKRLKLVSNKMYAWQTRMVRDLLYHSPDVTRVEFPVLTHYLLDGIARATNLEELEVMADMYYLENEGGGILVKAARIFLGTEDYYALMEKAEEEGRGQLLFPRLKKFYLGVEECEREFCHAMLYLYPDIKFKSFFLPEPEYLNRLIVGVDDSYWGIGSLFCEPDETQFGRSVMNVDNFIMGACFYTALEEDLDMCSALNPTNLIIFDDIYSNYELLKDILKKWTSVEKLGIKNTEFLEAIKDSYASQIFCIELSKDTCVFQAFDVLDHFPTLKHFMFAYPVEKTVYKGKNCTFDQIKELTITFLPKKDDTHPELLHVVMTSIPCLETLHLRGVTCAIWTSGCLKYCGHTSVKHMTLVVEEQLDACPCDWLDAFPGLEELVIKSTVSQKNRLASTSRLKIKYEGIIIPHIDWLDDYESNSYLSPDDEVVSIAESP